MADLKSKEDILYFMISGVLRISRSDLRFITNLQSIAKTKNYITSNQAKLLNTIILKYERQLAKQEMYAEKLTLLPWNVEVLESTHSYTDAFIIVEHGKIYFRSPYNKQFITDFKNHSPGLLTWNIELKRYEGDYSTSALKFIVVMAPKYFSVVNHCEETTRLLDSISEYKDSMCWDPTLVSISGQLMVAAINQHLADVLADFKLNTNTSTLARLANYGVKVHPSLLHSDSEVFAATYDPLVEISNIPKLVVWLKELGCDYVYLSGGNSLSRIIKSIITELNNKHLLHSVVTYRDKPADVTQFNFPVIVRFTRTGNIDVEPKRIAKVITMVNSEPIDIK
jgi:hypothetical protein